MPHKSSILSQDPEFYSAYGYEEEEGNDTKNVFIKALLPLLLVLSVLLIVYFAFNYISKMNVDLKKFSFWTIEKESEPPTHTIQTEEITIENKNKEQKVALKSIEVEPIIKKVIEELHQEKVLELSKIELEPIVKPTKKIAEVVSHKQEKNSYLVDEYLEAIKKELGKNENFKEKETIK